MSATIDLVDAPDVSIVVPVYRSAPIMPRLCDAIEQVVAGAGFAGRFELVLVCDAGPDDSWRVITGLAEARPFVLGVNLRRNAGQHNATMAGLARARGRQIVVMDDDLQHPPSFIPALLAELDRGYDACYTRYRHRQHAWWKKLGSRINDMAATLLLGKSKGLYLSSFKAMDRGVVIEIIK